MAAHLTCAQGGSDMLFHPKALKRARGSSLTLQLQSRRSCPLQRSLREGQYSPRRETLSSQLAAESINITEPNTSALTVRHNFISLHDLSAFIIFLKTERSLLAPVLSSRPNFMLAPSLFLSSLPHRVFKRLCSSDRELSLNIKHSTVCYFTCCLQSRVLT